MLVSIFLGSDFTDFDGIIVYVIAISESNQITVVFEKYTPKQYSVTKEFQKYSLIVGDVLDLPSGKLRVSRIIDSSSCRLDFFKNDSNVGTSIYAKQGTIIENPDLIIKDQDLDKFEFKPIEIGVQTLSFEMRLL